MVLPLTSINPFDADWLSTSVERGTMSRSRKEPTPIQQSDSLSEERANRLKRAMEAAKARGRTRRKPEDMVGTPRFDEISDDPKGINPLFSPETAPAELSDETAEGLKAMMEATAAAPKPPPEEDDKEESDSPLSEFLNENGEFDLEGLERLFGVSKLVATQLEQLLYPGRLEDPQDRMRQAVEKRCSKIDIGQYIMNGFVIQRVPIIEPTDSHRGLHVEFRTIPDSLEVFVDRALSEEASKIRVIRDSDQRFEVEMSNREYQRRGSEWALAAYIHSYQGNKWPSHLTERGAVNEDAMRQRLDLVRQLPSHVFNLLATNLGWFMERSLKEINTAVLGNG